MTVGGHLERLFVTGIRIGIRIDEIGKHKCVATLLQGIGEIAQSFGKIGARGLGFIFKHLPYDVQQMRTALFRRDELFHLVAEKQRTHLVVVDYGRE